MPITLTLVASPATPDLTDAHLHKIYDHLDQLQIPFLKSPTWLRPHHAVTFPVDQAISYNQMQMTRAVLAPDQIDIFIKDGIDGPPRLFLADMDATILTHETLDDLAKNLGIGDQVEKITAQAMRGELDFIQSLTARLQLIAGAPATILDKIWSNQRISTGAATVLATLRAKNTECVLISGGFTFFTEKTAQILGFHHHHGNILTLEQGQITARLTPPVLDKNAKQDLLNDYQKRRGIDPQSILAIGDGANDLPMLQAAGMGIGYHPKPILQKNLINQILYGDLTACLYAWGMNEHEIITTPDPHPL